MESPRKISPKRVATIAFGDFLNKSTELVRCTWTNQKIEGCDVYEIEKVLGDLHKDVNNSDKMRVTPAKNLWKSKITQKKPSKMLFQVLRRY